MDMTLEEQGAYRNLLDEAHLRGGPLPNDERILAKACGDALAWKRVQTAVMARFELRPDGWHNETLDRIIAKSTQLSDERSKAGQEGNRKRWGNNIANNIANASSPDPDLITAAGAAKNPPTPLSGGRVSRADREKAEHIRTKSWGMCKHTPRCDVYKDCIDRIARELGARTA